MTKRENLLRALRRNNPEWVPFVFDPCVLIRNELERRIGTLDIAGCFDFPIQNIDIRPTKLKIDYSRYYDNLPHNAEPLSWAPDWGIMGLPGSVAHFQEMLHPMAGFKSVDEINEYTFPDFNEDYRWEGVDDKIREIQQSDLVAVACLHMTIFEISWYLRGMDNFMVDMMTDPDFAEALLEKVTDIRVGSAQRFARAGVDIIQLGDDVATQLDMMISPELWRSLIKPRLAKVVRTAKEIKPDVLIFYHGDGNMQKVIPDLIEIGIDILNPVQPECMDPVEIKKLYGDKLSFWGTLGTQTILPFGTPKEVKENCKKLIEEVGKGGGLLIAPTHIVEPEVPIDNLIAFIEAVKEYGRYL